ADRNEAFAEVMRERGAEDESARLDAAHEVEALRIDGLRHARDRFLQSRRAREQRRDVLEKNALPREIGDVADVALDQGGLRGRRRSSADLPLPGSGSGDRASSSSFGRGGWRLERDSYIS